MLYKTLKPIAVLLVLLYVFSSAVLYFMIKNFYDKETFSHIEQTIRFEKAVHFYVSNFQKPAIQELQRKGIISQEYFDPRLLSSTFISQKIYQNYNDHGVKDLGMPDVQFKVVSDNPTNPLNLANSYENSILKKFRTEELETYSEYINQNNKQYLFYAESFGKNEPKCLQCHGSADSAPKQMLERYGKKNGFNEKTGDLHAIIALYVPVDSHRQQFLYAFFSIATLSFIVFSTIFLLIVFYARKIIEKDKLITKQSRFAAMGEMIGMIAHQWRQPLTGIGMIVDNLKLDIELETVDEKQWSENLDLMKTQIHYLSHTIDDFRNFFKPNQQSQVVNLVQLMDESLQIVSSSLSKNGVKIYKFYEGEILLRCYRNDLMQVILNLLKNANDALTERNTIDGAIKIGIVKTNKTVEIEISDNAGGIPNDIIDKIFDPYFSTKDEKNGTGLGLYMSKMIVEDHLGGKLSVLSDEDGSSFMIEISDKEMTNGN